MVGTGGHGDLIFAITVDRDQGDTGRGIGIGDHTAQLYAIGFQQGRCRQGHLVIAHTTDHADLGPQLARGQCLIGTLTTRMASQCRACHRLTRTRQAGTGGHIVEIDGTYDRDPHDFAPALAKVSPIRSNMPSASAFTAHRWRASNRSPRGRA